MEKQRKRSTRCGYAGPPEKCLKLSKFEEKNKLEGKEKKTFKRIEKELV